MADALSTNINKNEEVILETKIYILTKDDATYKFSINKTEEKIIIKCLNYEVKLPLSDLSNLTKIYFDKIDTAFQYINNFFNSNKVIINEVIPNKLMKLKFMSSELIQKEEKIIDLVLIYNEKNRDYIINELSNKCDNYETEISNLRLKMNVMEKEIKKLKEKDENKNNIKSYPERINFICDLSKESFSDFGLDNIFTAFNSFDKIPYLIYTTKDKSLIIFNLNEMKIIKRVENAHQEFITNINHFYDKKNKKDIIMTISYNDNNIRLWDIKPFQLINNIKKINYDSFLLSACFLKYNKKNYFLTSNGHLNLNFFEPIKMYDFKGEKILEIKQSDNNTNFITTYYDKIISKYFIISGNDGFINSYDLKNNTNYIKFCEQLESNSPHRSANIIHTKEITKLIDSCDDGIIRIWNFYTGELINKIFTGYNPLRGICIYNENFIFIGCKDKTIKLVDINKGKIVNNIIGHNNTVLTIKKIYFSKYGLCLISQGFASEPLKLWSIN